MRGEHCPPHLHVENEEVPWEARLAFSFVSDVVRLMDVDPIEDAPNARTIDRIKAAIVNNLPKCRAEWWARVGTCCLDNRWIRLSRDGTLTVLVRREVGAIQARVLVFGASSIGSTSITRTTSPTKENANRASQGTSSFST